MLRIVLAGFFLKWKIGERAICYCLYILLFQEIFPHSLGTKVNDFLRICTHTCIFRMLSWLYVYKLKINQDGIGHGREHASVVLYNNIDYLLCILFCDIQCLLYALLYDKPCLLCAVFKINTAFSLRCFTIYIYTI